jgi:hypothetical protein
MSRRLAATLGVVFAIAATGCGGGGSGGGDVADRDRDVGSSQPSLCASTVSEPVDPGTGRHVGPEVPKLST